MIATPLPLVEKSSGLSVEPLLLKALAGRATAEEAVTMGRLLRRMAIAQLFLTGLPEDYCAFLDMSANAWLHFLERAPEAAKATGLSAAYFDALACGDTRVAQGIVQYSRPTWNPEREDEDDFHFTWFLMGVTARRSADELAGACAALARASGDPEEPRVVVCHSLLTRDPAAFNEALASWIEERQTATAALIAEEQAHPDEVPTTCRLWVELVGVLRLAEQLGLPLEEEYPLAPSVARMPGIPLPAADTWKTFPSYREMG